MEAGRAYHYICTLLPVPVFLQLLALRQQTERLQTEVERSEQRLAETEAEGEQRERKAWGEREEVEKEQQRLLGVVTEQEAELWRRQASLSEACLEKETLGLQVASQDGTIGSLRSQV